MLMCFILLTIKEVLYGLYYKHSFVKFGLENVYFEHEILELRDIEGESVEVSTIFCVVNYRFIKY